MGFGVCGLPELTCGCLGTSIYVSFSYCCSMKPTCLGMAKYKECAIVHTGQTYSQLYAMQGRDMLEQWYVSTIGFVNCASCLFILHLLYLTYYQVMKKIKCKI